MTTITDYVAIAKGQNAIDEELAQKRKEQARAETLAKNEAASALGQQQISELEGKYRTIYDENAVRQYVGERRVAENMANLGLTDSGLNRTQQTALQVSRGNADHSTRLQYEAAVRSIEQSVRDEIASNDASLNKQLYTIDEQVATDNSNRLYNAQIKQLETVQKAEKEATEKAEKEQKEAAEKQQQEHKSKVNSLATALKTSRQSGVGADEATQILRDFIIRYNLSRADAEYIMTYAGISAYRLASDYFEKAERERDRWHNAKTKVEAYNAAQQNGTNYDLAKEFKSILSSYNVEQYGADKLLPLLLSEQLISSDDVERIKYFYNSYIGSDPAEKSRIYGKDKIISVARAFAEQGMASSVAAEYMVALYNYYNKT